MSEYLFPYREKKVTPFLRYSLFYIHKRGSDLDLHRISTTEYDGVRALATEFCLSSTELGALSRQIPPFGSHDASTW